MDLLPWLKIQEEISSKPPTSIHLTFWDEDWTDWQLWDYTLDRCAELRETGAEWKHVQDRIDDIIKEYEPFRPRVVEPSDHEDDSHGWNSDRRSEDSYSSADDNYDSGYKRDRTGYGRRRPW